MPVKKYEDMSEELKLAHHAAENASLEFLKRHTADYVPNLHNNAILAEAMNLEMARTKTGWTLNNLESCFDEYSDLFNADESELAPPAPTPTEPNAPPYGVLTAETVGKMPHEEYRRWYRDKNWGGQFQKEVNDLQIRRNK